MKKLLISYSVATAMVLIITIIISILTKSIENNDQTIIISVMIAFAGVAAFISVCTIAFQGTSDAVIDEQFVVHVAIVVMVASVCLSLAIIEEQFVRNILGIVCLVFFIIAWIIEDEIVDNGGNYIMRIVSFITTIFAIAINSAIIYFIPQII